MLPESCDERFATLCSPELGACHGTEFSEILGAEVREFVVLPVRPKVFDRVQLGAYGGRNSRLRNGIALALDIVAHQATAVR